MAEANKEAIGMGTVGYGQEWGWEVGKAYISPIAARQYKIFVKKSEVNIEATGKPVWCAMVDAGSKKVFKEEKSEVDVSVLAKAMNVIGAGQVGIWFRKLNNWTVQISIDPMNIGLGGSMDRKWIPTEFRQAPPTFNEVVDID